jgi:hypothetical protein
MATELKTRPTDASVTAFIDGIENETRRDDCRALIPLMEELTGATPRLWGENIVGFGECPYAYASGRTGTWFQVGFSPRKQNLTLYLMGSWKRYEAHLQRLGKHKLSGGSCLYVNKLSDIDLEVLKEMIALATTPSSAE